MPQPDRAKRNTIVLVLAQAMLGAQMPMIFTVGGLAGQSLAPNPCLSTLPISMIILGSVFAAQPLSAYMARHGRRPGFIAANGAGALGAAIAAYALWIGNFWLFLAGSLFTGVYLSAQGFYRFAATDAVSKDFAPKAISYVLAGGLISAVIGPQLVKVTATAMVIPFLGTYLAIIAINALGPILFAFLDIPPPPAAQPGAKPLGRTRTQMLRDPKIVVAIICAMVSYALMNLVMTATPLAVVGCGYAPARAADIVSAHVLAMYIPSFFTGHLIARFGRAPIVGLGLCILAGAGAAALSGIALENFFLALVLLGLGWNFGFIGATAMLAAAHKPEERGRVQGLNDVIVFSGVFLASLASGGLMSCAGESPQAGWAAVNLAMVPFLTLAGAALIWLMMRPKDTV
ncbi:multidrug MFS transporter [Thioclava sp. SK-1]|nr:multidrug MFS transporter [Thioclava sp. SK-1]